MGVLSRFTSLASKFPLLTTSVQAGSLMCCGDLISQKFVEKKTNAEVDLIRTGRFGLIGFILVGPILRTWYGLLERIVLKTPAKTAMAKMAADQLFFAPIFLGNFMVLVGTLNGHNMKEIKKEIEQNYVDIMIRNYQLWPAAQMINFWAIPLQHRVLFAQSVAVIWNTYLSYKTNRAPTDVQSQKEKERKGKGSNATVSLPLM